MRRIARSSRRNRHPKSRSTSASTASRAIPKYQLGNIAEIEREDVEAVLLQGLPVGDSTPSVRPELVAKHDQTLGLAGGRGKIAATQLQPVCRREFDLLGVRVRRAFGGTEDGRLVKHPA